MTSVASTATPTGGEPNGQPSYNDNNDDARSASTATPDVQARASGGSLDRHAEQPNGFRRDGRSRNPIPSKLQGLADNSRGNFAIMQLDVAESKASERNAAAQRTSEGTAAHARRANLAGWQPVRRSKSAWHTDEPHPRTTSAEPKPAAAGAASSTAALAPRPASLAPTAGNSPPTGSSPQETKAEQARLLTLLRTLHPVLVVDQLCKALAYFGGVPDAPPPQDGLFPSSARTNGPGSLLVAWLSEIYPPVSNPAAIAPSLHLPPLSSVAGRSLWGAPEPSSDASPLAAGKRTRGRPKGSKSSKVRKDKGIKKTRPLDSVTAPEQSDSTQPLVLDDDEPGNSPSGNAPEDAGLEAPSSQVTAPSQEAPGSSINPDASTTGTPGPRKRGRPKGSKNRPKLQPSFPQGTPDQSSAGPASHAQTATSRSRLALVVDEHTPVISEGTANGLARTNGPSGTVSGTEAALPAAAASIQSTTTPTLPESQSRRQQLPSTQDDRTATVSGAKAPSRKRAAKRPAQNDGQAAADGAAALTDASDQNIASRLQGPPAKRQRISKEGSQISGAGSGSQILSKNLTTSPALDHQSLSSALSPSSTARSFDSQSSFDSHMRAGASHVVQQSERPPHPQIQQTQRLQPPQSQQQSPRPSEAEQHRQYRPVQAANLPTTRNQAPGIHGGPPRGRQQKANISPQMLYQQQQAAGHMGPDGRPGVVFGRRVAASHPQYAQQNSGGGSSGGMPRQRNVAAPRTQGMQQASGAARQTQEYANQQRSQGTTQGHMGSMQGYAEQSYLNMDYGLTERDVREAAEVTALDNPTQLHGHDMYQAMGQR